MIFCLLQNPLLIVNHPYFIDFVQSLCFAYNPLKKTSLSTTILNKEISIVLNKIKEEIKYEKNLTLGTNLHLLILVVEFIYITT
jgi:hypothetical protein